MAALPEEEWRPNGYPEQDCLDHPASLWEWDGYGWICSSCVIGLDPDPVNLPKK